MKLNSDQRKAFDHLKKQTKGAYLIEGHAGTGKTYLAAKLARHVIRRKQKVLVLCPTHQAKYQLAAKLPNNDLIEVTTVASFLAQYPSKDKVTGEYIWRKGEFGGTDAFMILVDEVSMVSEHEVTEILSGKLDHLIVFLGDFAQLRPVMKKQGNVHAKLKKFVLRKQHRNAGPILQLCSRARTNLVFPARTQGSDIIVHKTRRSLIKHLLSEIASSKDPTQICYLAYRNRTVNKVRVKIHRKLYGPLPFYKGQHLRLDDACRIGKNGTIVEIMRVTKMPRDKIAGISFTPYRLKLLNLDTNEIGKEIMVSFKSQTELRTKLQSLYKESAKYFKRDKAKWAEVQSQINEIRDITPHSSPFSQTIHKAQGRTIPKVYVDTLDLSTGNDRVRLGYVGYSRAQHQLHTIKVPSRR